MTAPTAPFPKLTAARARQLHDAEVAVAKLEANLKIARETRDVLRAKVLPKLGPATDPEDADNGVLEGTAGGVSIRATLKSSGESFSLKRYRELGHQVTAAMREAIAAGRPYRQWTVKPVAGPKKIGAVEPA